MSRESRLREAGPQGTERSICSGVVALLIDRRTGVVELELGTVQHIHSCRRQLNCVNAQ